MNSDTDPRIEAVAKLLFTGPLFAHDAEQWQPGLYEEDRADCLMAAEDVLRGIDEAAAKDMLAKNRAAVSYELSVEDYYQRYVHGQKAPE